MPLYPYRCTQCGHRFEKIQSFKSEPEKECPQCQGALERLLTAPRLQFKGEGWYINDYASKSNPALSSSPASRGESSSEAAPAAAAPAPAPAPAAAPAAPAAAAS